MEESFPRGGSGPSAIRESEPPAIRKETLKIAVFCSLSVTLVSTVPANRFVLAQCVSASRGKVFVGCFPYWGQTGVHGTQENPG